ncbi:MAG: AlpA family phage regulatory protein [Ideonella sp.]|nr:AlpA family phage regulatory protein [Ideonella sp.]
MPSPPSAEFLRIAAVVTRTGLGRSTIYRLIAERKFPTPVRLAGRAVGWRRTDLDNWSEARPSTSHAAAQVNSSIRRRPVAIRIASTLPHRQVLNQ